MKGLLFSMGLCVAIAASFCAVATAQGSGQVSGQQCWIDGKLVGGFPPGPCPGTNTSSSSNNAISHHEAREYSRYVSAYSHAIDLRRRGLREGAAKAIRSYEAALNYLEEALRHNPGDSGALRLQRQTRASLRSCQGQLLVEQGDYERAITLFREAEEIDPSQSATWRQNIDWARSRQKREGVNRRWTRASQLHASKDWRGAEAIWREILTDDPNNFAALYNLGNDLMAQERFDEAMTCFQRSHAINPTDEDTRTRIEMIADLRAEKLKEEQDKKAGSEISSSVDSLIGRINQASQTGSQSGAGLAGSQLTGIAQQQAASSGLGFDTGGEAAGSLPKLQLTSKGPRPTDIPEKYMKDEKIQGFLIQKEQAEQKYRDLGAQLKTISEKLDRKEGKGQELDSEVDKILDQMTVVKKEAKEALEKAVKRVLDLSVNVSEEADSETGATSKKN